MLKKEMQVTTSQAFGMGACVGVLVSVFSLCALLGFVGIWLTLVFPSFSTNNFNTNQTTGVEIIADADNEAEIFPESWLYPPSDIHITKLKQDEVTRSINVVQVALQKYPPALHNDKLQRVYVFDTIIQYGASIGGTYSTDQIYLVNSGLVEGYTDQFIERALHEEYSSILLRTYPDYFDDAAWIKINPTDFVYEDAGGYNFIKEGKGLLDYDPDLLSKGFLNIYSTSNKENDFNAFAARLLMGEFEFWQAVDTYDPIKQKALLVIAFYQKLDPMYTEEYFISLQQKEK